VVIATGAFPGTPAVTAAIHHATGVRLDRIPATPERVWAALRARSVEGG
jgi:CO/xanthine dehydrogenase Mo-binding subunit